MTGWLVLLSLGASGLAASGPATGSAPAVEAAAVERLVGQLGDPRFEVRQRATERLCQADLDVIGELVRRYRAESSHERKLRLRQVVEHLYFRKLMQGEVGFLGIQLALAEDVIDPATGRRVEGAYAQRILEGHPAAEAGVRDGDLIVRFDDKPISWFFGVAPPALTRPAADGPPVTPVQALSGPGAKIERFTRHVKRRAPGSTVRIGVLRPIRERRKLTLTVAEEPGQTLDGVTWVPVPATMVGISPASGIHAQGGLLAAGVMPGSPADRAGLQPREIVTALNGKAVPPQVDPRALSDALGRLKPGEPATIEVAAIRELELTVTIGRRPVSRLNPDDLREAREQFAVWWEEQTREDSIERSDAPASYAPAPGVPGPPAPEPAVVP